jgi:signal transduction histidine kinase
MLFVTASAADATILARLVADTTGDESVQFAWVEQSRDFFDVIASERSFHIIVLDDRLAWSPWQALAAECARHRSSSILILLSSSDVSQSLEDGLPRQVAAVYPRNSAGLVGLSRLVLGMASQRRSFSLHAESGVVEKSAQALLDDERQKLVYAVSHDLQDPLQLARRYAAILDEDFEQELGDSGSKVLGHLQFNLGRTQEMLDELLDYSRLQRAQPEKEPVDLNELLDEVISLYRLTLDEIGGSVVRQQPLPTLMVDRRQFQRVFQNLIGNAIKFRSERPLEISVRAQRVRQEWRIGLKDNGIGVNEDDAKRIFDMFERGSHAEDAPGTGMGLAICSRIVQNHGGRIWVRSTPGGGSVFIFSVPQVESESDAMTG